jgi:hypothetical protein
LGYIRPVFTTNRAVCNRKKIITERDDRRFFQQNRGKEEEVTGHAGTGSGYPFASQGGEQKDE